MKTIMMALVLAAVAAPMFAQSAVAGPFFGRRFVCVARNHRGAAFEGVAFRRFEAEREALNICSRSSRSCVIVGCSERF